MIIIIPISTTVNCDKNLIKHVVFSEKLTGPDSNVCDYNGFF